MKETGITREELLTKDNLEKWIKEGKTYLEIGRIVGLVPNTIRNICEKYEIKKQTKERSYIERKEIPDDYKDINIETVKKACERKVKEGLQEIPEGKEGIGIYGILNGNNEWIYVGCTENFKKRIQYHKNTYENANTQPLYKYIRQGGGWENHKFILLEERNSHKGLNYIESIWWKTLQPIGNIQDPMIG